MRTMKELLAELGSTNANGVSDLRVFWQDLIDDDRFKKILTICSGRMGKYSPSYPESELDHVQRERNGGFKGWLALEKCLLNIPDPNKEQINTNDIYGERDRAEL